MFATRGYWLPVAILGLLLGASAPTYVDHLTTCLDPGCPGTIAYLEARPLSAFSIGDSGLYWVVAILVLTALTAAWGHWSKRYLDAPVRVRGAVTTWLVGLALLAATSVPGTASSLMVDARVREVDLVVAVAAAGVIALGISARSRAVWLIGLGVLAWALLASLYNVENLAYDAYSAFGATVTTFGYEYAPTVAVLVPGTALLTAGVIGLSRGNRRNDMSNGTT